jgi:hypothetical protein
LVATSKTLWRPTRQHPAKPATAARAMHRLVSERRKQERAVILLVIPPAVTRQVRNALNGRPR